MLKRCLSLRSLRSGWCPWTWRSKRAARPASSAPKPRSAWRAQESARPSRRGKAWKSEANEAFSLEFNENSMRIWWNLMEIDGNSMAFHLLWGNLKGFHRFSLLFGGVSGFTIRRFPRQLVWKKWIRRLGRYEGMELIWLHLWTSLIRSESRLVEKGLASAVRDRDVAALRAALAEGEAAPHIETFKWFKWHLYT